MTEYECIKPFSVICFDLDTDSFDEEKMMDVEAGSVWERENCDLSGTYTGADIHLTGDNGWLEVSEEILGECFKEL